MKSVVNLRPHHLLCTKGFQGKGYSKDYSDPGFYNVGNRIPWQKTAGMRCQGA